MKIIFILVIMEDEDCVGKRVSILLKSYKGQKGTVKYQGSKSENNGQYGIECDVIGSIRTQSPNKTQKDSLRWHRDAGLFG